jgi:hypothetical protein
LKTANRSFSGQRPGQRQKFPLARQHLPVASRPGRRNNAKPRLENEKDYCLEIILVCFSQKTTA